MITMSNPTGRNTKAYIVTIGEHELFFSYQTLIAYRGVDTAGNYKADRIRNFWDPTTDRHFNELGCGGFEVMQEGEEGFADWVACNMGVHPNMLRTA